MLNLLIVLFFLIFILMDFQQKAQIYIDYYRILKVGLLASLSLDNDKTILLSKDINDKKSHKFDDCSQIFGYIKVINIDKNSNNAKNCLNYQLISPHPLTY